MKKELVKPSPIINQLVKEIESLCDGFSCASYWGSPSGDTGSDSEILF